jgi:uncharacterized SAM-binding protein YcdF (DUF218 family)
MADAIIVLGRGINEDGSLPIDPQSRVRKAVELYKQGTAPVIIMSGASSYHFDINPERTESKAMKEYAIELGVSDLAIIEESKSKDTIGNIYFTKKDIAEPRGFRRFQIVASGEHMARIKYLFEKIYGPTYQLEFIESDRVIDDVAYSKEVEHESKSMAATLRWLENVSPGDDEAVKELMNTVHPAYAP